jgi:hypothetical protein
MAATPSAKVYKSGNWVRSAKTRFFDLNFIPQICGVWVRSAKILMAARADRGSDLLIGHSSGARLKIQVRVSTALEQPYEPAQSLPPPLSDNPALP